MLSSIGKNTWIYIAFVLFLGGCGAPSSESGSDSTGNSIESARVTQGIAIEVGDEWRYRKGTSQPSLDWTTVNYDDSSWLVGNTGIGYGDGDDATVLSDMSDNYDQFIQEKSLATTAVST